MFDIKTALKDWRVNFENSDQFSTGDLDEMENHLIDGVDVLKNQNLTEEEAFLVAAHRLGKPEILEHEFQKAHPNRVWQKRILWMITGFLAVIFFKSLFGLVSNLILLGGSFFTTNFSVLLFLELGIGGLILFVTGWFLFKLFFSKDRSVERFIPARLRFIHYTIIAIFVSIGQPFPEYLRYSMGQIHHTSYWQIWSEYGGYLDHILITYRLVNFIFPLLLLIVFITLNRSYKRVNG